MPEAMASAGGPLGAAIATIERKATMFSTIGRTLVQVAFGAMLPVLGILLSFYGRLLDRRV